MEGSWTYGTRTGRSSPRAPSSRARRCRPAVAGDGGGVRPGVLGPRAHTEAGGGGDGLDGAGGADGAPQLPAGGGGQRGRPVRGRGVAGVPPQPVLRGAG